MNYAHAHDHAHDHAHAHAHAHGAERRRWRPKGRDDTQQSPVSELRSQLGRIDPMDILFSCYRDAFSPLQVCTLVSGPQHPYATAMVYVTTPDF